MTAAVIAGLVVSPVLAGCSGSEEPAAQPVGRTTPSTPQESPSPEPSAPSPTALATDRGTPAPKSTARTGKQSTVFAKSPIRHESDAKARLIDLTAEADGDVEQVTFTFADTKVLPKYTVNYVDVVRAHPEDDPIAVEGNAFLEVGFKLTNPNTEGRMAVEPDLRPDLPLVKEMLLVENLGGSLRFAVGLDDEAEFRVQPMESPTRLVVEVRKK